MPQPPDKALIIAGWPWKCERCKDSRSIWNGKKVVRCPDCKKRTKRAR